MILAWQTNISRYKHVLTTLTAGTDVTYRTAYSLQSKDPNASLDPFYILPSLLKMRITKTLCAIKKEIGVPINLDVKGGVTLDRM